MTVPCMVLLANPGQEDFPPLPPDQDMPFFNPPKLTPKDPDSIINYRGNRIYRKNGDMEVAKTAIRRLNKELISLEITFTQSLNPRSVNPNSFIIDDEPLPEGTKFFFNRKGDTVRILVEMEDDYFYLIVQDIYSFNGKLVEPVEFELEIPLPEEDEEEAESGSDNEEQDSDELPETDNLPENEEEAYEADYDLEQANESFLMKFRKPVKLFSYKL